ncbi:MAG: hypothetical protein ACOC0D_05930 [Spirochaeta sp.]
MRDLQSRKPGTQATLMGVISAVLHQTGIFLAFFAVPAQYIAVKRGLQYYVNAVMISLGVIALWKGFQIMSTSVPYGDSVLIMLDLFLPAAVFLGLGVLNFAGRERIKPEWIRISLGSLVAVVGVLPLLVYAQQSAFFAAVIEVQYEFYQQQGILQQTTQQDLMTQLMAVLFRGVGGMITALLSISYYFGSSLAGDRTRLQRLSLPRFTLAAAGICIILILVGTAGVIDVIAWNLAAIVFILYALVGMAVISRYLAQRFPGGQGRYLVLAALLIIIFVPLVNIVVLLCLPVAGIAETVFGIRERYWNKE